MEKIENQEHNIERPNPPEKSEKAVSIVETPADDEVDTAGAGRPGNWKSKIGISIPKSGKWNPSFQLPSLGHTGSVMWKLVKFYGPGAIISVAYIDPDNYQTAIVAGALFQFKLLFMILLANIIAIYLQVSQTLKHYWIRSIRLLTRRQVLSAKLGAVTGMTLAEMHRVYLPRWLNYTLWFIAEATIICTDVGQVLMSFPRHS